MATPESVFLPAKPTGTNKPLPQAGPMEKFVQVQQYLDKALLTVTPPNDQGWHTVTFSCQIHTWPNVTKEDIIRGLQELLAAQFPKES